MVALVIREGLALKASPSGSVVREASASLTILVSSGPFSVLLFLLWYLNSIHPSCLLYKIIHPLKVRITHNSLRYVQKTCIVPCKQTFNNLVFALSNWVEFQFGSSDLPDVNQLFDGKKVLGGWRQSVKRVYKDFYWKKKKSNNYSHTSVICWQHLLLLFLKV